MPKKSCPPSYRLHKARNCAVVTIAGKNHYLGPYGSEASKEKYARLIAEHCVGGGVCASAQNWYLRHSDTALSGGFLRGRESANH